MSLIHFCGFCQSTSAKGGKLTLLWESKPVFLLGKQQCRAQAILGGKALKIKRGHACTRTPAHTHQFQYSQTTIQTQEQLQNICEIVQDCIVNVNTGYRVNRFCKTIDVSIGIIQLLVRGGLRLSLQPPCFSQPETDNHVCKCQPGNLGSRQDHMFGTQCTLKMRISGIA